MQFYFKKPFPVEIIDGNWIPIYLYDLPIDGVDHNYGRVEYYKKLTLLSKRSVAKLFYWFLPAQQSKRFGVLDAPHIWNLATLPSNKIIAKGIRLKMVE